MADALMEKREYTDGVVYTPAAFVQPGVNYYVQRKDEQGKDYYLSTTVQNPYQTMVPNPQATYMPQAAMYTNTGGYGGMVPMQQYSTVPYGVSPGPSPIQVLETDTKKPDFGGVRAGHFTVTILGLFFAPVYLIGFPVVFAVLRSKMRSLGISSTKPYQGNMSTYSGFGWATWSLVFLGLLMVCIGAPLVHTYSCDPYYSRGYGNGYTYGYTTRCESRMNVGAFISAILGGVLWGLGFIFNIVVIAYGGSWIKRRPYAHY